MLFPGNIGYCMHFQTCLRSILPTIDECFKVLRGFCAANLSWSNVYSTCGGQEGILPREYSFFQLPWRILAMIKNIILITHLCTSLLAGSFPGGSALTVAVYAWKPGALYVETCFEDRSLLLKETFVGIRAFPSDCSGHLLGTGYLLFIPVALRTCLTIALFDDFQSSRAA